jgi:asparagine synthase (glutamine-hydrolysing)
MCGIAGEYTPNRSQGEISHSLRAMTNIIAHRGPDDDGHFVVDGLGIGMRRLSIIDLEGGQQPIYNEDQSLVVVFNGEIYNYVELRAQLEQRGHTFSTHSDTEVIVHLYEDYGDACMEHMRGMFAFALWDMRQQRLLLARDRLGIKPLYVTQLSGGGLVFGSEIKALLQHPHVEARPDLDGLNNFLSLKYVPAPHTMFMGIDALPPGYRMVCDANGVRKERYWDVSFAHIDHSRHTEEEFIEELERILRDAVRLHLRADVPFGAFVSGGIDSSTIVALMSQIMNQPVKTFTVGYSGRGAEFSELPYASMVSDKYQTEHYEVMLGAEEFVELMPKIVWHLDQPIADQAAVANYVVARKAREHVKMVLTGEGGDELFAGYARYVGEQFSPMFQYVPKPMKHLIMHGSQLLPGLRRQKLALYALCQDDEFARFSNWFPLFNPHLKDELLSSDIKAQLKGHNANDIFAMHLAATDAHHPLNRMLYVDTKLWLPDDLLARGDKTSMAASIEARLPLLDHHVVEFAATVPPHYKVNGMTRKYLLRRMAARLLPEAVVNRKKEGFPMPVSVWWRYEAREFVRDTLAPDAVRRRGLFDADFVMRLLNEHETGFRDAGTLIWSLLNVELWYQQFIDQPTAMTAQAMGSLSSV